MDDLDRRLLIFLLEGLPFTERPFGEISSALGLDEAETLLRTHRLLEEAVIGPFASLLDLRACGYQGCLAAASVPQSRAEAAVSKLMEDSSVRYVFQCDHTLAVWFTLVLPPAISSGIYAAHLGKLVGAEQTLLLAVGKRFTMGNQIFGIEPLDPRVPSATPGEEKVIRVLLEDIPLTDRPFHRMGREAGMEERDFLEALRSLESRGFLRRIAASAAASGKKACARRLAGWAVPEERLDAVGRELSSREGVLHVSERKPPPGYPFRLFAVLQSETPSGCDRLAREIGEKIGGWPSAHFPIVKECSKSRTLFVDGRGGWDGEIKRGVGREKVAGRE